MIKDQEYLKFKASYCLDLAKKLGATDASVTVGNSISESVSFRNRVLDESNRSDSLAISIETYIGKKRSSISSSNLLDENLKTLISKCFETTKITPEDEFNSLPDKDLLAGEIKNLNLYDESHLENDKKIDYLRELEEVASIDKKIVNTESGFTENKSNFILANSDGFCNGYRSSSFSASCVTVAKDENSMERDYEFTSKCHLNDIIDPKNLGKIAAEQTIKKLSPKKIGSDKISIIFDKRIAKGLLSSFASAISSSAIARGTSFLKDKIDQQIFSSSINIFDKPDLVKGMGSQCFDSEGVKSEALKLVEKGFLKEYLVDTYSGKKLNLRSNGRSGGSTNLYFENGQISFEELLKIHSRSLYITETIGHGTNLVTGDYSVGANGFLVENGELKYPVSEITIAGNFNDMFKSITLANDLDFKYSVNSPTMMIEGMTVAGK
ncbi:metallopeptidase TldD-related protein [Candidatus Pelagibacter sp.]|jgi:PmbA protein|nr:metallopeptidase TldD-related protein [Candidatus Pelagibacter sp.]MDA7813886.1 metallopeptidase TldD-related protein [Candidatus Pelagibacter sp.]MDA9880029.1 metallopeptidase TldD-related protein [Candidatus Pelagibacter sp.]MDB4153543.1 metallopeptidase TldD-related protein [Candidatus Pelagibacter sp.]MDC0866079.1 metallopeptidase TldD-related protein [Candidatus Pelagibacter sp.]|tara:strand:- start:834 stop:2150 length:1317 start_codon:yes stop_codon:yes gene_type:complete